MGIFLCPFLNIAYDAHATKANAVWTLLVLPSAVKRIMFMNKNMAAVLIAQPLLIGLLRSRNRISNGGVKPIPHVNNADCSGTVNLAT